MSIPVLKKTGLLSIKKPTYVCTADITKTINDNDFFIILLYASYYIKNLPSKLL